MHTEMNWGTCHFYWRLQQSMKNSRSMGPERRNQSCGDEDPLAGETHLCSRDHLNLKMTTTKFNIWYPTNKLKCFPRLQSCPTKSEHQLYPGCITNKTSGNQGRTSHSAASPPQVSLCGQGTSLQEPWDGEKLVDNDPREGKWPENGPSMVLGEEERLHGKKAPGSREMLELHLSLLLPPASQVSLCSAIQRGADLQGSKPSGLHLTHVTVAFKVFIQMINRKKT